MTDRLEEIERMMARHKEDYHRSTMRDDVAFLLGEVRRLMDENDKFRELTTQELSWQTEAIENHEAAQEAQSLALSLAEVLDEMRRDMIVLMVYAESKAMDGSKFAKENWAKGSDDIKRANSALSDNRLTKLREMKNA